MFDCTSVSVIRDSSRRLRVTSRSGFPVSPSREFRSAIASAAVAKSVGVVFTTARKSFFSLSRLLPVLPVLIRIVS